MCQDPYAKKQLDSGKASMFNSNLFAPDVVGIGEKYYLYYGVGLSNSGFGVAVADSPAGPFTYSGWVRYPKSEHPAGWKDCYDGIDDGDMAFGQGIPAFSLKPGRGFGIHVKHYPYDSGVIYDNGRLFLYYRLSFCRMVELDVNAMCDGTVEICVDKPDADHCVAKVRIDKKSVWQDYKASMLPLKGCHAIYFIIHCDDATLGDIAFFEINVK